MPHLALFDFDGTITFEDSFTAFVLHAVTPSRLLAGKVLLSPLVAAYRLGVLRATVLRASIVRFGFAGRRQADVEALGTAFARAFLPTVVRPESMARIQWHLAQGDRVVVVSASLDVYLREWCRELGLELICTRLESREGVLTGRYLGGDCTAGEKARRVREAYDLSSFASVFAYGDTGEDEELLGLADRRFFQGKERLVGEPRTSREILT